MAKSPQELRDEADETESSGSEKAQKLREAADKKEDADKAEETAEES